MLAVLSLVACHSKGLVYDSNFDILAEHSWAADSSEPIQSNLNNLFHDNNLKFDQISEIACITGPGSFTGLRSSCAFVSGFALAKKIPSFGLPCYSLFNKDFYIPLRHQKAVNLSIKEYLSFDMKFLHVISPTKACLENPKDSSHIVGLKDSNPDWPSATQVQTALRLNYNNLKSNLVAPQYGFTPSYVKSN